MKTERDEKPEITLVSPIQSLRASCSPNYPDGPCGPSRTPCIPDCGPNCVPSVIPKDCGPTRGEPKPPPPSPRPN